MNNEILYTIYWWVLLLGIGLTFLPLKEKLLPNLQHFGLAASKIIGIVTLSFVIWVGATLKIIAFTQINLWLILIVLVLVLNRKRLLKRSTNFHPSFKKKLTLLSEEGLFVNVFVFWTLIRGFQPDIRGLEKFMDYGFINSILNSQYLPPRDMWFAGGNINYYWFGHFWAAVLTKLSGIPSEITYNLLIATIAALVFCTCLMLVSNMYQTITNLKTNLTRKAILAGLISAILLVFGGNFHTPYFLIKKGVTNYWYADATRFIGYNPETDDKTIHEFPLYSFVVSDLHAHLLNLPFVILFLSLLWQVFYLTRSRQKIPLIYSIPTGFLLGIMFATNSWDFATYFLITGVVILFTHLNSKKAKIANLFEPIKYMILVFVVGLTTTLPFIMNFESIVQGVGLVHTRTPLWQLAILWGLPAIFTILFIIFSIRNKLVGKKDLFVLVLLFCAWLLILLPEVIYIKDIYISSFYRANTMFKFTYQAFVIFYTSLGFIAVRISEKINYPFNLFVKFTFTLLLASVMIYPILAINSYYNSLRVFKGLSGISWLNLELPDIYLTVNWFKENTTGQPTILEAVGDSYTDYNVISSYTGLPTVQGWLVHEWLWRGTYEIPGARAAEVETIYTSQNIQETKSLLEKYNVRFVVVGKQEREKYYNLFEQKFNTLGELVFSSGSSNIYKVN